MTAEQIKHFRWKFGHKLLLENVTEVLDYLDIVYDTFQVSAKSNALVLLILNCVHIVLIVRNFWASFDPLPLRT